MHKLISLLALALCLNACGGPTSKSDWTKEAKIVEATAQRLKGPSISLSVDDIPEIEKYTYPGVFKLMGGREGFRQKTASAFTILKMQGVSILSLEIGKPYQFAVAGPEIHCLISTETVMMVQDTKMRVSGHMMGISTDEGKTWKFVNLSKELLSNPESMKKITSHYEDSYKLPAYTEPTIVQ